jgi:hypothetical protein
LSQVKYRLPSVCSMSCEYSKQIYHETR